VDEYTYSMDVYNHYDGRAPFGNQNGNDSVTIASHDWRRSADRRRMGEDQDHSPFGKRHAPLSGGQVSEAVIEHPTVLGQEIRSAWSS